MPRVAELFIHKEKQRGCPLLGANRYTHLYITLGKELSLNKKDKLPDLEKEGVYSLKCGDCEAIYVGTGNRTKFENSDVRTSEGF